ncbi:MAG: cupin domain-containing protein [Chloroflexi bacterium]|nr:cupin domain-containing protein [Chloroflexota bacterium]
MGFSVYDYRTDIRNVLVTPQIRARFFRLEPGTVAKPHTHDLGHEIFLMLQGRAVFEIDGERAELGPGQMCVALANQSHGITVTSAEPVIMYLSVTPHIQPTHTMWTADGKRLPHRFVSNENYDVKPERPASDDEAVDRHVRAAREFDRAVRRAIEKQLTLGPALKKALEARDETAAKKTRDGMWEALFEMFRTVDGVADAWNDLAPRGGTG